MKIIDVTTFTLLLVFPEISGKFPEILNFRKIYNPSCDAIFWNPCTVQPPEHHSYGGFGDCNPTCFQGYYNGNWNFTWPKIH